MRDFLCDQGAEEVLIRPALLLGAAVARVMPAGPGSVTAVGTVVGDRPNTARRPHSFVRTRTWSLVALGAAAGEAAPRDRGRPVEHAIAAPRRRPATVAGEEAELEASEPSLGPRTLQHCRARGWSAVHAEQALGRALPSECDAVLGEFLRFAAWPEPPW